MCHFNEQLWWLHVWGVCVCVCVCFCLCSCLRCCTSWQRTSSSHTWAWHSSPSRITSSAPFSLLEPLYPLGCLHLVTSCVFADQLAIWFVKTVAFTLGHINVSPQNEYKCFFLRKWPIISLDKTLFLSLDRAEPFEALTSPMKLHWFGLQHAGCAWSPLCGKT